MQPLTVVWFILVFLTILVLTMAWNYNRQDQLLADAYRRQNLRRIFEELDEDFMTDKRRRRSRTMQFILDET